MEGLGETLFFIPNDFRNEGLRFSQLRVGFLHQIHHPGGGAMEKRLPNPKNLSVPHRPSHDPTENISPSFVGGKDAIINQKDRRSAVICDDPNGAAQSGVFPIGNTADDFNLSKDGLEEIGFVVTLDTMEDG